MSELSSYFDDSGPNEFESQVNTYENLDPDDDDIYGDSPDVPSLSTFAPPTRFKFPKSAGPSGYLLVNDDNVVEATNLLKVYPSIL